MHGIGYVGTWSTAVGIAVQGSLGLCGLAQDTQGFSRMYYCYESDFERKDTPFPSVNIYICCYVLYLKSALASGYLPYWFPAAYEFGFHALSALQAAFCISRQHFRSRSSIGSPRRTFTYQSSMIDRYRLVHRQVSCLIGTMPYNA